MLHNNTWCLTMPRKRSKEPEEFQVRLILKGSMARKFDVVKKHHGFEQNADLVRMLITKEYKQIEKERVLPE